MPAFPSNKSEGNGLPSDKQSHKQGKQWFGSPHGQSHKLNILMAKGGMMFFVIERYPFLYKGAIMLSAVQNNYQKRSVYIKEYRYKDHTLVDNLGFFAK